MTTTPESRRVLVIDNDADLADVVRAILEDEGHLVEVLGEATHDVVARKVGQFEPDCVLLDGNSPGAYGSSWTEAAYLATRPRSIPVVMFSAHMSAVREVEEGTSQRASDARFAAVIAKPFELEYLLDAIAKASNRAVPFDRSPRGDTRRTKELRKRLVARGANDVRTSERREWATFKQGDPEAVWQIYWWQSTGVYLLGRYRPEDGVLEAKGHFLERDAALDAAFGKPTS